MRTNIIIFDLDGTLANIEHRRHFVERPKSLVDPISGVGLSMDLHWKPDWEAFYKACVDDTLSYPVGFVYRALRREINMTEMERRFFWGDKYINQEIEIWSGREESVRSETEAWLAKNRITDNKLRMRPTGDYTPDEQLKEKWLMEVGVENVLMVFDDRDKVVKMWRSHGIPCFQVAEGNF